MTGSFRQVPTFADTIRRFSNNISELRRLAARDYEDLLQVSALCNEADQGDLDLGFFQCAMPVFEGLLPEPHNTAIQQLLFTCAHWHGLAKLHMHTDQTLQLLDNVTVQISTGFQAFNNKTCPAFDTQELRRETEARKRRALKKAKGKKGAVDPATRVSLDPAANPTEEVPDEPLRKKFNLQTYKYHALGDYADTIRRYGTSDSYSTEPVSDYESTRTTNH